MTTIGVICPGIITVPSLIFAGKICQMRVHSISCVGRWGVQRLGYCWWLWRCNAPCWWDRVPKRLKPKARSNRWRCHGRNLGGTQDDNGKFDLWVRSIFDIQIDLWKTSKCLFLYYIGLYIELSIYLYCIELYIELHIQHGMTQHDTTHACGAVGSHGEQLYFNTSIYLLYYFSIFNLL